MKAMILAAGRGERMALLTKKTPKPLLPINGIPLIEIQLQQLCAAGISEVVVNLHHLGDRIEARLGSGQQFGVKLAYSREESLLETGGGIVNALPLLGSEPFIILNGDIYTDFDFASLPHHLENSVSAHLVLTPTPDCRSHGDFEFRKGRVTSRGQMFVYTGIAVCHPKFFDGMTATPFSWMDLVFPATERGAISGQLFHGKWTDIGTLEQYEAVKDSPGYG